MSAGSTSRRCRRCMPARPSTLHAKFDPARDARCHRARARSPSTVLVPAQLDGDDGASALAEGRSGKPARDHHRLYHRVASSSSQRDPRARRAADPGLWLDRDRPIAAYLRMTTRDARPARPGLPALHCQACASSTENGSDVPAGADGEILVRGPECHDGLLECARATATALARRLVSFRRYRPCRRRRRSAGRRAQERHDHFRRREHLPRGNRERPAGTSRHRRGCVVGRPDQRWGEAGWRRWCSSRAYA